MIAKILILEVFTLYIATFFIDSEPEKIYNVKSKSYPIRS